MTTSKTIKTNLSQSLVLVDVGFLLQNKAACLKIIQTLANDFCWSEESFVFGSPLFDDIALFDINSDKANISIEKNEDNTIKEIKITFE